MVFRASLPVGGGEPGTEVEGEKSITGFHRRYRLMRVAPAVADTTPRTEPPNTTLRITNIATSTPTSE